MLALPGAAEEGVPSRWVRSGVQQSTPGSAGEMGRWEPVAFAAGQGGRRLVNEELAEMMEGLQGVKVWLLPKPSSTHLMLGLMGCLAVAGPSGARWPWLLFVELSWRRVRKARLLQALRRRSPAACRS